MNPTKGALAIIGVILLLAGVVFALQGANVIGGSSVMDGNPTYIYVGGFMAVIGVAMLFLASRSATPMAVPQPAPGPQPAV